MQHAVTRVENFQTLTPPPVPQGAPRFTSRGIAHPTNEAFPPYLQPEVTFIEGSDQVEIVDTDNGDGLLEISPVFSRSQGGGGLSEHQRRNLLATPPCGPLPRLPSEHMVKELEEFEFVQESPVSHADTRSIELVRNTTSCMLFEHPKDPPPDHHSARLIHKRSLPPDYYA